MDKLKTLGEITDLDICLSGLIPAIREEAIKWVMDCNCYPRKDKTIVAISYCNSCLRFINFFNITDEELNDVKRGKDEE